MSSSRDKNKITLSFSLNVNIFSGLTTGLAQAIGLHPIDRALYLQNIEPLKDRQHLFAPKYWTHPMSGIRNTIYQRILSSGLYYTLQAELNSRLFPLLNETWGWNALAAKFGVGFVAGSMTGFVSNASYAVKFYTINHKPKNKPLDSAISMWKKGGYKPFVNGICPGVMRDALFGSTYETINFLFDLHVLTPLQQKIPDENEKIKQTLYFITRFLSAAVATTISSPFNYARNMQFKTEPHNKQASTLTIWSNVWNEANRYVEHRRKPSHFSRLIFFKEKFMIGPGTIRAAGGMALGQMLFNKSVQYLRQIDETPKTTPKSPS